MLSRRKVRLVFLGVTIALFFTFSKGFETTTRRHVSYTAGDGIQRVHKRAESKYQRATVDVQVHHAQWSATVKPKLKRKPQKHLGKGTKHGTNTTNILIELNGPNVCGTRCCTGWTVSLKTKKCTKPRCLPRCHNGAVCRQPNTCVCRPGFQGHRCEHASVTYIPTLGVQPRPTTTPAAPITGTTPRPDTVDTQASRIPSSSDSGSSFDSSFNPIPSLSPKTQQVVRWQPLTLKEAQSVLLKKALTNGGRADKITSLLFKHIEAERKKLHSSGPVGSQTTSVKTIHTQRGQYTIHMTSIPASNQTAGGGRGGGVGGRRGAERIKVLFTPTICKVRCTQGRCTNFCERGNVTTLYSSGEQPVQGPGFRVFLCPMLCRNGGVCIQKDRCLCPINFTGKFCHIPVTASTNDIEKPPPSPAVVANQQVLTQSEYILPLQSQQHTQSAASGSSMVKVRVQHPPEATVKIHQVLKVGYGPTVREQSETVTWSAGLSGARNAMIPGERAEAPPPQVQAQTLRGDSTYTESSGFKYCFREVRNGQCSSPLPGLRSQETCCRGIGLAWGINECTLCPSNTGNSANGERNCPKGYERNGTQCVDINECLQPGFCENGNCVNTRGSYTCVCRQGYLLDASHGICISQKVISEDKGQCYRILTSGACTLPILRNITKQICCCSRVGKAWGKNCEKCPYFGTEGFREICPAGPGYHYSASAIKFNQRVLEQLGSGGATLTPQSRPQQPASTGTLTPQSRPQQPASTGTLTPQSRPQQPGGTGTLTPQSRPQQPGGTGTLTPQSRPQQPGGTSTLTHQRRPEVPSSVPANPVTARPTRVLTPHLPQRTNAPQVDRQPLSPARPAPLPVPATPRPAPPRPEQRPCEKNPQVCGPGRCVDLPGGRHTCVCNPGYLFNTQQARCLDVDECKRTPSPCGNGQCQNTEGGYRCTCPTGYRPGPQGASCIDLNECLQTPRPCSIGQCENTLGSYRCLCPPGFTGSPQQTLCLDVDECRQTPSPCANGRCENTVGGYRCVCPSGFKLQGNTCTDINECEDPSQCPGQECVNSQGSYRCVACRPGFTLLNGQCSDIDECRRTPSPCTNGHCENSVGSYKCVCLTGYKLQDNTCTDINECEDSLQCPGQECVNSQGSYRCVTCRPGYSLQNGQCSDVDECENALQCPGQECVNSQGSYRCVACRQGFNLLNGKCSDVDECRQTPSPCTNGHCENTAGSYRCVCLAGYQLQGNTCTDIDECRQTPGPCASGRCENTAGSYRCVCPSGFKLQGNTCTDIDECRQTPNPCTNGRCENTAGSYRCVCLTGYKLQGNTCTDIDECRQTLSLCANGRCENTAGSYRCVCPSGFKLQGNTCIDINECEDPSQCPGQECVNSQGSYRCVACRPGFNLLNGQCSDIDECRQTPSPCANGRCENTAGSYRCVCPSGFKLQGNTCIDINECEDPSQCPGQECVNSQGSYRCVACRPGFTLLNGKCSDIDECRQTPSLCANGRCENTAGSYRCTCLTGYKLQGNTCADIDECRQTPSPCANGRCENTAGSYRCVCPSGYKLQGNTCTDVDECENALQCPGQECVNSEGSFSCVACKPGHEFKNGKCQDIDECRRIPRPCANGHCENTPGSYRCECSSGYKLQDNACTDIDECEDPLQCPGQECVNSQGSYICVACKRGYSIQNRKCSDVDECQNLQICGPDSRCVNTDGSYRCDCKSGFRASSPGRQCRDINECQEGEYCFPRGECVNLVGSYRCVCSEGYKTDANGTACVDVDECTRSGVCQDGSCVNTEGSFECQCQAGFTTNPEKTACLDVDECAESEGTVCGTQRCENSIGSYRCFTTCEPGYKVTPTGVCVDINECANETICGEHSFCQNLIGTYHCMCDQGYEVRPDGRGCVDENECESMRGVCGAARCENVEGSFMCECPGEGEELDMATGQCVSRPRLGRPVFSGGASSSSANRQSWALPDSAPVSLPAPQPGETRECYYNTRVRGSCNLLARNTTHQECCCTIGEGWGLGCQFSPCPDVGSAEYQALCPSGRGYVTSGPGAFSYRDVDECKVFAPEVCKSGVCVNNIPGYSCYCPSGYYYDTILLECIDNNECEGEEICNGGTCVNTVGSYYCSCEPPLVLDDTQRSCVNSTSLTIDENLSFCWQHVTADLVCQSPLLDRQVTFTECCCIFGEAWGLQCALCPARDSDDFEVICNVLRPPAFSPPFTGRYGPGPGRGGGYGLPYGPDPYPDAPPRGPDYFRPGYDDYQPPGGRRPGFGGRPLGPYGPGRYYEEEFDPRFVPPEPEVGPPFRLADPLTEPAYGAHPRPPSRGDPRSMSLAPLPENSPFDEEDERTPSEPWRPFLPREAPPFPDFPERSPGGGVRRETFERRYESYEGLSAEECGILRGCENGRCIRVAEGYTCDCYDGYQLDMTSMACIDINECDEADDVAALCVNGQCVNTEGSYRCVCMRGFVMSRRPNHCIPSRS